MYMWVIFLGWENGQIIILWLLIVGTYWIYQSPRYIWGRWLESGLVWGWIPSTFWIFYFIVSLSTGKLFFFNYFWQSRSGADNVSQYAPDWSGIFWKLLGNHCLTGEWLMWQHCTGQIQIDSVKPELIFIHYIQ